MKFFALFSVGLPVFCATTSAAPCEYPEMIKLRHVFFSVIAKEFLGCLEKLPFDPFNPTYGKKVFVCQVSECRDLVTLAQSKDPADCEVYYGSTSINVKRLVDEYQPFCDSVNPKRLRATDEPMLTPTTQPTNEPTQVPTTDEPTDEFLGWLTDEPTDGSFDYNLDDPTDGSTAWIPFPDAIDETIDGFDSLMGAPTDAGPVATHEPTTKEQTDEPTDESIDMS